MNTIARIGVVAGIVVSMSGSQARSEDAAAELSRLGRGGRAAMLVAGQDIPESSNTLVRSTSQAQIAGRTFIAFDPQSAQPQSGSSEIKQNLSTCVESGTKALAGAFSFIVQYRLLFPIALVAMMVHSIFRRR